MVNFNLPSPTVRVTFNLAFLAFDGLHASNMNEPAWLNIFFAVRAFALQRWLLLLVEVHHLFDALFVENMLRGAFRAAECDECLVILESTHANAAFLRLFWLKLVILCKCRISAPLCDSFLYYGAYAPELRYNIRLNLKVIDWASIDYLIAVSLLLLLVGEDRYSNSKLTANIE